MKKNRSTVSILLLVAFAVILLSSLLSAHASADISGNCGANLKWSFADGILTITGSGDMINYTDPGLPPWYETREQIRKIVLPDKLTSIGDDAFFGCSNLMTVSMPDSVTYIGSYAFADCSSLMALNFPDELKIIGEGAFSDCINLKAVYLPAELTTIGTKAFYRCESIAAVTIPGMVTSMGVEVFAYCRSLLRATINAEIPMLPVWNFYGCENLQSVSLSSTIKEIGLEAFTNCESIETVYTQTYELTVAEQLSDIIADQSPYFADNGYVAIYDQPDSTVVIDNGDEYYVIKQISDSDNSVITVTESTNINSIEDNSVRIDAVMNGSDGWTELINKIEEVSEKREKNDILEVKVQLTDTTINSEDISTLTGKPVDLTLVTSTGISWLIEEGKMSQDSMSGVYELDVKVIKLDSDGNEKLKADSSYQAEFIGNINFPSTVGIPLQKDEIRQAASLFEDGSKDASVSVRIDDNSIAWYPVSDVTPGSKYDIGVNVINTNQNDVVIPKTLSSEYGGLVDLDGNTYKITGRTSKWGITGGQFALYMGLALGFIIVVVTVVMISINRGKMIKQKALSDGQKKE